MIITNAIFVIDFESFIQLLISSAGMEQFRVKMTFAQLHNYLLSVSPTISLTYQRSCNSESINYGYFRLFTPASRGQRKQLHCAKFSLSRCNLHSATERKLLHAEWTANAYPIRNIRFLSVSV